MKQNNKTIKIRSEEKQNIENKNWLHIFNDFQTQIFP